MHMMNICQISRSTLRHTIGGMERYGYVLANELRNKGHKISTVTTSYGENVNDWERGERAIYLTSGQAGRYSSNWWKESANLVKELHLRDKIDVIWSQSIGGFGYVLHSRKDVGIPCVVVLHGTIHSEIRSCIRNASTWRGFKHLLHYSLGALSRYPMTRKALPLVDHFVAVSSTVAESAMFDLGISGMRLSVVPVGIDTQRFRPREDAVERVRSQSLLELDPESLVLIAVSRLHYQKGLHLAINAFHALKCARARFIIIGDGPQMKELQMLVDQLGLSKQVFLLGAVENEDLPYYLSMSDIFVSPTMHSEGLPVSSMEAMAMGLPVVSARIGGVVDLITDGETGLLFHAGDVNSLRSQIHLLVENPSLRLQIGRQARQKVMKRHSVTAMANEMESIFVEIAFK